MTLKNLLSSWEKHASAVPSKERYRIHLNDRDAAKVAALAEMFPGRTPEQIITELLAAALTELEHTLPYVQGENISSRDEMGDPIYEDIGPLSKFSQLTQKHLNDNTSH